VHTKGLPLATAALVLFFAGSGDPAIGQDGLPAKRAPTPTALVGTILVKNTVIALGHALNTGNFSVLRDLAAPSFREANDAASLAGIFADLKRRKIDLTPIVALDPVFREATLLNNNQALQVTGYFPSRPMSVTFNIIYQDVAAQWRPISISVGTIAASQLSQGLADQAGQAPREGTKQGADRKQIKERIEPAVSSQGPAIPRPRPD